jgi:hypothetical protein
MANLLTNPGVLTIDSVGVIKLGPVWVKALEFVPALKGDSVSLVSWDLTTATGESVAPAATISATGGTITATGGAHFPSTWAVGDLADIIQTTGLATNMGKKIITTAGNNTVFKVPYNSWTNEASKAYHVNHYTHYDALEIKAPVSATGPSQGRVFGDPGIRFESLGVAAISANCKLYLYI